MNRAALLADASSQGRALTLVSFWATWCAPCIAELPALDTLAKGSRDRGLRVVGVALEDPEARAPLIDEVLASHPVSFPMVVARPSDHAELFAGVGRPWDGSLPAAWLLDADGRTVDFMTGSLDAAALDRHVVSRLAP